MTRKTTAQADTSTETETAAQAEARTYIVQWEIKRDGQRLQPGDEIELTDDQLRESGLAGSACLKLKD